MIILVRHAAGSSPIVATDQKALLQRYHRMKVKSFMKCNCNFGNLLTLISNRSQNVSVIQGVQEIKMMINVIPNNFHSCIIPEISCCLFCKRPQAASESAIWLWTCSFLTCTSVSLPGSKVGLSSLWSDGITWREPCASVAPVNKIVLSICLFSLTTIWIL